MTDNIVLKDKYQEIFEKEYSIIQDKIDKIGEFKFKIRGWSITVQAALFAALFTKETPSFWPFIGLLLLIPLIFHFLELQQQQISNALMDRAVNLENAIERLIFRRNENERIKKKLDSYILNKVSGAPKIGFSIAKRNQKFGSMLKSKENLFYYFQYILFSVAFILSLCNPSIYSKPKQDNQGVACHSLQKAEGINERNTDGNYYRFWGAIKN